MDFAEPQIIIIRSISVIAYHLLILKNSSAKYSVYNKSPCTTNNS